MLKRVEPEALIELKQARISPDSEIIKYCEDLTDDWDVVSHTATTISLIDVSGGNGGTDTLVFTKN